MNLREYERTGFALYGALAEAVAAIIDASIKAAMPTLRYQPIQRRAKGLESLEKKIATRPACDPELIEADIKDLAGCRLVFYTNNDVARFANSRILPENFDIIREKTKIHQPVPGVTSDQFRSENIVLRFKEERAGLAEYARFKGLLCEVQIQTILNHAWADTAHDILYKKPTLTGLGARLMDQIDNRLKRIMEQHLLPAGYEFQKVWDDFERLMKGQSLLDADALEELVSLQDNNGRHDRLAAIRDHLLPNLDSLEHEFPSIRDKIVASVAVAQNTPTRPIEVPGGAFDGITLERYLELVGEVISEYRYIDVLGNFRALCSLFLLVELEKEREILLSVARHLAKYNRDAWEHAGPGIQAMLMAEVNSLPIDMRASLRPMIVVVLQCLVESEIEGSAFHFDKVTWSIGAVVVTPLLSSVRKEALSALKEMYRHSNVEAEKRQALEAILGSTRVPTRVEPSEALTTLVLVDTAECVRFFTEIAPTEQFEVLQSIEHDVLWIHRNKSGYLSNPRWPQAVADAAVQVATAVTGFRAVVDARSDYVRFKTIVGYESVFPPAWDDDRFEIEAVDAYRQRAIEDLVAAVSLDNAQEWFGVIARCASTVLTDGATFRSFYVFLDQLGLKAADVALSYLEGWDDSLARFLSPLAAGVARTAQKPNLQALLQNFVSAGRFLAPIAYFIERTQPFENELLERILHQGITTNSADVVLACFDAVVAKRLDTSDVLEQSLLAPAMTFFRDKNEHRWMSTGWLHAGNDSLLSNASESTLLIMLDNLRHFPKFDHRLERILLPIARRHPDRTVTWLAERIAMKDDEDLVDRYEAVPHRLNEIGKALDRQVAAVLAASLTLFGSGGFMARHNAPELVRALFPIFSEDLQAELHGLLRKGDAVTNHFIAMILREYRGVEAIYGFCRDFVEALPVEDELLGEVRVALLETDGFAGEFGLVKIYKARRAELEKWLSDPRAKVVSFAASFIVSLDNYIAAEQARAEDSIARRRLDFSDPEGD